MINEPFATGTSVIHRIDPRGRIIFAAVFSMLVAVAQSYATLICAILIAWALVLFARLNPVHTLKRTAVVFGFLLLIWLVMPFTYEGEAIGHLGPFAITRPGVSLSGKISLKSISILLAFIALIATIRLATLGHALERLCIPNKLIHLLLMTYRYIFVIEKEYQRLLRAAKIRGFKPGTDLHTYKTYAYFLGVLFVRAAERAERVSQAMKCRGFQGRFYCLSEYAAHPRNRIFSCATVFAALLLVALEWIQ
jgi:cobalt/nickel transport system permease protein